MVILGLADIHGRTENVHGLAPELKTADMVLLIGDITHFGRADAALEVIANIRRYNDRIRAVSGNCDYAEVDQYLEKEEIQLHGRGEVIDSIGFVGLGGSPVTPFRTPNEYGEDELEKFLDRAVSVLPKDIPMVVLSHTPPLNTDCDRIGSGKHVGSRSLRVFIETYQPLVCFTGHIHESSAIDQIGKTRVINPGRLGENRYAYAAIDGDDLDVEVRTF